MAKYGYDPNVNYMSEIHKDLAAQDYRSAAIHEAQRNEKIAGEGITDYKPSSNYSAYLPHTDKINSGIERLAAGSKWSYDANKDPAAQAYRKQFLREADRQTRDTMANYAGMTGGVPSTAAVAAGQQAGNYQRAQLADKTVELMNADYNRWLTGREQDRADLGMLSALDQQSFDNSRALQSDANARRQQEIQNAMSRWSTLGRADEYVASILGVPVGTSTQDAVYQQFQMDLAERQQQHTEEMDRWQMATTEEQQQMQNALSIWTTEGTANEYVASILRVPVGTPTSAQSYQNYQMAMGNREMDLAERQQAHTEEMDRWQMATTEEQQQMQNALSIWTTEGTANEYVASILRVPVGTPTSAQSYQNYQMAMGNREMDLAERQQDNTERQQEIQNAMSQWAMQGTANEHVATVLGVPVGTSTQDAIYQGWQMLLGNRQQDNAEQQQAIQNAFSIWTTTGRANEYVASILHVPVGTSTQDAIYQGWQMDLGNRQQNQSSANTAYSQAMDRIDMGVMPSAELLQAAGISTTEAQQMVAAAQRQLAGSYSGGGSSSGSRGRSGSGSESGSESGSGSGSGSGDTFTNDVITKWAQNYGSAFGDDSIEEAFFKQYGRTKESEAAWKKIQKQLNKYVKIPALGSTQVAQYAKYVKSNPQNAFNKVLAAYEAKYGNEKKAKKKGYYDAWQAGLDSWWEAVKSYAYDNYISGYEMPL